jgi:hypothetical protein
VTPEEIASVLAYFSEAWPWAELGDHAVEVWADAVIGVDGQRALTAARRLVRSEERPPSIKRFLDECKIIEREQAPAIGAVPTDEQTRARSARRMAAVNAGWGAANELRPAHDHRRGAGQCPRCSTAEQFIKESADEILDAITADPMEDK